MAEKIVMQHKITGKLKKMSERSARIAVKTGRYIRVQGDPAPVAPPASPAPPAVAQPQSGSLEDVSYHDLLDMVKEQELEPESRKKEDLIRALRYSTRELRAEG